MASSSSSSGDEKTLLHTKAKMQMDSIGCESENFLRSNSSFTRSYSRWSPNEEGVTLAWRDLNVYVHAKNAKRQEYKRIVKGVTGAVKAGSLVALLGSSGAGKTTLMSALAYRTSGLIVEGDILVNGRAIGNFMRHLSGFMEQDDLFVGSLTVWEHMNIMARLKLDRRTSAKDRKNKIYELLRHLGLMKCLNIKIGGSKALSGGEKKRLAFASEILTDPPLLFCDEPTTGLDSYSAQKLITMMNLMATTGKTIVCTIHQPSSQIFAMFSQLLLFSEGRIAYMGSVANAIQFFDKLGYKCPSTYNPADFFIRTLAITPGAEECSKQTVKFICDNFAVSDASKEVDVVVQYEFHMERASQHTDFNVRRNFKESFWWTKLFWLTYRCCIEVLRDPSIQIVILLQKIVIAIIIGVCYAKTDVLTQKGVQAVQGVLFMFVTESTFLPMYSVLASFPEQLPLFTREYKSGLYPSVIYYISKILSMIPGLILEPIIFILISYWLIGLKSTIYAFSVTVLTTILVMNVSVACGIFFSNAFTTVPNAMAWLVSFDNILMITSGLFIRLSTLPYYISWTKYLSWLMYASEAMSIVQWDGVYNITCETTDSSLPCISEGSEVLEKYNFSQHLGRDLWYICVLCIIFHVLAYFCLWKRIKSK